MDLTIPYWHPAVVHFPIALLLFGAAAAVVYGALGRAFWRGVALLAFAAGTAGAWAAVRTGKTIYEAVEGEPVVEALVGRHQALADWTLWVSAAVLAVLAGAAVWTRRTGRAGPDPLVLRLAVTGLAVAAAVLVAMTGRLGGQMVWGVAAP
ncbi:MAG: DUF2231 domain-containing protein [Bacteroidota bacterium]